MEIFVVCQVRSKAGIEEYDPIEAYLHRENAQERATGRDDLEVRSVQVVDADEGTLDRSPTADSQPNRAADSTTNEATAQAKTSVGTEDDTDTQLYITVEAGTEGAACPVCGTAVDTDRWTERSVTAGDRGGAATYGCPTADCPGEATILW